MKKFLLLILLLVEIFILQEFVDGCKFTSEHTVYVVSNLPSNSQPLKVHCASGDDELGYHFLRPNQNFHWKFCANFYPDTLFFCHFWWESKDKVFDVYKEKLTGIHTLQSWWVAKSDGIYFSNQTQPTLLEKRHDWNK